MNFDDLDIEGLTDEWLSRDFMSLPHDSDSLWNDFSVLPTYETNHVIHREPMSPLRTSHALSTSHHQGEQGPSLHSDCDVGPVSQDASDTRIRMVSPLNDVSNVDHIPYAWNPSSAVTAHEPFVEVHDDDTLFSSHVPSHDISQSTYDRICRNYQVRTHGNQQHRSHDLPVLGVFNLFLGLFFTRFHPQAPYLHLGTLDTNRDLRSHILSIMAAIGAVYSGKKGSRRFAVHMFEESRRQFQTTIEVDNTLMRDPMTIYSGFLICFTGIWCGNKRAFELAEALRGQIVTYIRKLGAPSSRSDTTAGGALNDQWRQWIHDESLKRLQWLIYQLDAQFPTLLHILPMMSLTEILDWSCPCDDEFWSASSARHWKSLLGPASIPPSKSFSAAIAAFMYPGLGGLPVLRLNCWSAYLLITAIHVQIFAYSEVRQARNMYSEEYQLELPADTEWRRKLLAALHLWHDNYHIDTMRPGSVADAYFSAASRNLYEVAAFLLHVSISDLQDIIGKSGKQYIQRAKSRMRIWSTEQSEERAEFLELVVRGFQRHTEHGFPSSATGPSGSPDWTPSSPVAFFLFSLFFYAMSLEGPEERRNSFRESIAQRPQTDRSSIAYDVLKCGFEARAQDGPERVGGADVDNCRARSAVSPIWSLKADRVWRLGMLYRTCLALTLAI
ncbi:fungal specific transcription factor domain-containing protein 65 [Elsinoe australis]|uniref:Fungal specific transcription factor domain-containing protein 65 n=1 Tax=Elsinoe australis TaxID=40998 RepID=A0A4U7AMJ5_9PEZI|nr:fungal specific transcription factor domain-containing protein 65 [Elsinoe australis]